MTTRFDKDVQGVALYLEFRKTGSTCQIIITPEGMQTTGEASFAQFFRRVISDGATKRKWQAYTLKPQHTVRGQFGTGEFTNDPVMREFVVGDIQQRVYNLSDYFSSLANRGYKLVKDTPIYVEVTKADMDSIRSGDLPTKLWTRVKSSRNALDFPAEVVDSATPTVVASTASF